MWCYRYMLLVVLFHQKKREQFVLYHDCYFQEKVVLGYLASLRCRCPLKAARVYLQPQVAPCALFHFALVLCFHDVLDSVSLWFSASRSDLSSSSHTGTQLQADRLGELLKVAVLHEAFRNAE